MQSPDHPELPFIQARYYQKGRPSGLPIWIVAHTMEAGESGTRAENTAEYFRTMPDGRVVSANYCGDNDSIVATVKLMDTAFTTGNIGNRLGINWEFAGFAGQTPAQWGDDYSMSMLRRAAPYWYADAERFGIPIQRCSVVDLQALRPGLTTHNDLRVAFGGTTHTDPGPAFPWSEFIDMINKSGGPDMSEFRWRIESSDPAWNGALFLSDGVTRRKIRTPGSIQANVAEGWPTEIVLNDQDRGSRTWESHLDGVLGPDDAVRWQALTDAIEAIPSGGVQSITINGTLSGTVSGSITGSAGVATEPGQ